MTNRLDRVTRQKAELIAAARLEIARRIARFCTSLTPAEFERLLDKMVHIRWKYDILPDLDPTTFEFDDRPDVLEA